MFIDNYNNKVSFAVIVFVTITACTSSPHNTAPSTLLTKQPVTGTTAISGNESDSDGDSDGVVNSIDECPETLRNTIVMINGCPLDTDADGVMDSQDVCRGTPLGVQVNARGCGFDDDDDGIANYRDSCANSPPHVVVDASGCEVDTDNDGVVDSNDKCAGTPPGVNVEPMGCLVTDIVILHGANFKSGSSDLTANTKHILQGIAKTLQSHPRMQVEIAGHTDNTGSFDVNKNLSQKRAAAAKNYLVEKGVVPTVLTVKGYADTNPLVSNDSDQGRQRNRRVEIRIVEID